TPVMLRFQESLQSTSSIVKPFLWKNLARHQGGCTEPQIGPDHRLRRMRQLIARRENMRQVRRVIQVAAVLEAQSEVWNHCPVETRAVHKDRPGVALTVRLVSVRMEKDEAAARQHKRLQHQHRKGNHPVRTDFM